MKPQLQVEQNPQPNHVAAPSAPASQSAKVDGSLYFRIMRRFIMGFARLYFRIEFIGFENIPTAGGFIVAPNHQSFCDPFWVSIPFPYPLRYMTWDRFVYMPVLGHFIRSLGAFPVDIKKGDRTALRLSLEHIKNGGRLMVFPEGGRTKDGQTMPFKPGVIRLALDAKAPIIPATIVGGYEAYNAHHLFPRPRKVKVVYHPPIYIHLRQTEKDIKDFLSEQAAHLQSVVESGLKNKS